MLEEEYEQQVVELNWEISSAKKSIEKQTRRKNSFEQQSNETIRQLTEENQMLSRQVKQAGKKEKHLVSTRQAINTEITGKKTNMQEHINNIDNLSKKISGIGLEKLLMEKQIEDLVKEINNLTLAGEHSSYKLRQLERKTINQLNTYRKQEANCEKLRSANQHLSERLGNVSTSNHLEINKPTNLQLELESCNPDNIGITNYGESEMTCEDYEECSIKSDGEIGEKDSELDDLRSELLSSYKEAEIMCKQLMTSQRQKNVNHSTQTIHGPSEVLLELEDLIMHMGANICEPGSDTCKYVNTELEIEVHKAKENIEQTESKMKQIEAESKQKLDQVEDLKCQVIK